MSYKPEVQVSGNWEHNSLFFATKEEAELAARDLMWRWRLVTDWRAVESDEPVNCAYVGDVLTAVEAANKEKSNG
jgi:hypothetical protein